MNKAGLLRHTRCFDTPKRHVLEMPDLYVWLKGQGNVRQ